jgi:hypothetical protein
MSAGDLSVKRKVDKVQIVREPKVVIATLEVEDALELAKNINIQADKILAATASDA